MAGVRVCGHLVQLIRGHVGPHAHREHGDAGVAQGFGLGSSLVRVVGPAVGDDDGDVGHGGPVAVVGVEHGVLHVAQGVPWWGRIG